MKEVEEIMETLIRKISETTEYNQYQVLLDRVKKQPELYQRIGDFRRRSMWIQMAENIDKIRENNNLQNEFGDLKTEGLANDFLIAEHQYCIMVRKLQDQFLKGAGIDTSFLEG